jgi:hypothetical protein
VRKRVLWSGLRSHDYVTLDILYPFVSFGFPSNRTIFHKQYFHVSDSDLWTNKRWEKIVFPRIFCHVHKTIDTQYGSYKLSRHLLSSCLILRLSSYHVISR